MEVLKNRKVVLNYHLKTPVTVFPEKTVQMEKKMKLNWAQCPEKPASIAYFRKQSLLKRKTVMSI